MWLIGKGQENQLKVIIFEEGANIITDIDQYIEHIHSLGSVKKGEFSQEKIHEIWKLNGNMQINNADTHIRVYDMQMRKYLHDSQFVKRFLTCMDILFSQENKEQLAPIVFFDTYLLAAGKNCSRLIEKNILRKVIETISEWNYEIKPHPNDFTDWKYEKGDSVTKYTNVPVEVLRLRQLDLDLQEVIYISYGYTGCVANELFLLGGTPYVIFLYKILRLYGIEYPGESLLERLYEECEDTQKKKIFFPATFAELKTILYQITGKDAVCKDDFSVSKEKELSDTGREVRKIYNSIFRNLADELNETSIMCMDDNNEWKVLTSKKILVNQQKYRIEFDLPMTCSIDEMDEEEPCRKHVFRWYIARGAIVKVKLLSILCFDQEDHMVHEVSSEDIVWLDVRRDDNGWHIFNNCDPIAEFQILQKDRLPFRKIVIESEMEWDMSYEAMRLLRNKNLEDWEREVHNRDEEIKNTIQQREELARALECLTKENEAREKTIQQLNAHLEDWEREVHNRDEEIKNTIRQREELNATLVNEREQWLAAMAEKEKRIEELELQCSGWFKGGLHPGRKKQTHKKS